MLQEGRENIQYATRRKGEYTVCYKKEGKIYSMLQDSSAKWYSGMAKWRGKGKCTGGGEKKGGGRKK